jgi:hypothetical protein
MAEASLRSPFSVYSLQAHTTEPDTGLKGQGNGKQSIDCEVLKAYFYSVS